MQHKICGTAALSLATVIGLSAFSGPAGATPGSRHVASGAGRQAVACAPEAQCLGDYLSIDASDQPGLLGHATYASAALASRTVNIAFTCVVINDIPGGHTLYASGSGSGSGTTPGTYFVVLTVTGTSSAFDVSSTATTGSCGAAGRLPQSALGAFKITPVG